MVTGEGKRRQRASIRWKITGAIVLGACASNIRIVVQENAAA